MKKIFIFLFIIASYLPGSNINSIFCIVRVYLAKKIFKKVGKGINILAGVEIGNSFNLTLGNNSGIGKNCTINCMDNVVIGNQVLMGPEVMIFTSNHVWNYEKKTYFGQGLDIAPVRILDDAWLGARSIVLPGVTIGKGCTVAAGSVVTKSTEDFSVVAGVPARVIKFKHKGKNLV